MMTKEVLDLSALRISWSQLKRINWHIESFPLVLTLKIQGLSTLYLIH